MLWLEREHPELVGKYTSMYYGKNAYAPKDYRKWLAAKIKPLIRQHGLERGREDAATGGVKSRATSSLIAEELPSEAAARYSSLPLF
jgi:prophage antirepressor-like protein